MQGWTLPTTVTVGGKPYVVLDEDVLTAIATIRTDAAAHLEG